MARNLKATLTNNKDQNQYHILKLDPEAHTFSLISTPKVGLENYLIILL